MSIHEFEIRFAEEVEGEIREIFQWYSFRSPLAEKKLKAAFDGLFEFLSFNPYSFSKKKKDFRIAYISKFPIAIIYEISGNVILILRVIHTSRHPRKRFQRLRRK